LNSFRVFWQYFLFFGLILWVFFFYVCPSTGWQDKTFYYAVVIPVLFIFISGGGRELPKVVLFVVLLLFALMSPVFWSGDQDYWGLVARYLRYFLLTSFIFFAPFLVPEPISRLSKAMLWAIVAGGVVAAILQWMKFIFVLDFSITSHGVSGVGGIGINPNVTGAAMGVALLVAPSVALSIKEGWRGVFLFIVSLLFLSSMGLALARTAFVAVAAVLVLKKFPLRSFTKHYLGIVVLFLLFLLLCFGFFGQEKVLIFSDDLLTNRISIWRQLLNDVSGHWWFGLGLQRELEFVTPGLSRPFTAHNLYLQVLRNGGFFAFFAILALVFLILRNIDTSQESEPWRGVLVFGLIYALVDAYYYPVSDPNSNWLFLWLPAAYLLAAHAHNKKRCASTKRQDATVQ
jgi:hypothetical protein